MDFKQKDVDRFWEKVDKRSENECWNWIASVNNYGYGTFHYKQGMMIASRFAYLLFYSFIPEHRSIKQSCENRLCCNPNHLYTIEIDNEIMDDIFIKRFWGYVDIKDKENCWNWMGHRSNKGYGETRDRRGKIHAASRVAYEIAFGIFNKSLLVCHKCDNPMCCNPDHLFLGTSVDNNSDMANKNRSAYGSKNGNSKLTEEDVKKIKVLLREGVYSCKEIFTLFNISKSTLYNIRNNKIWKRVII
jgi:hypothetical protein